MDTIDDNLDIIEKEIFAGLKDFQKATVEQIDVLFRPPNNQRRILVSDEVGLGKTLIAKGVIARFAKMRREEGDDLLRVVYICANGAITEQNLKKLSISKSVKVERTDSSRLSMQHLKIFLDESDASLKGRYIQMIPLTPDTSFRITSGQGTYKERVLMFEILRRVPVLKPYIKEIEKMFREPAKKSWDNGFWNQYYKEEVERCDKKTNGIYTWYMMIHVWKELCKERPDGQPLFDILKDHFDAKREGRETVYKANDIIAKLRMMFAEISIEKLNPDLVIMDEFQRFKYLLKSSSKPENELTTGIDILANKFFNSDDMRILLLSATPYKMYSTMEEIAVSPGYESDHYLEFLAVMKFLNEGSPLENQFETDWENYSIKLRSVTKGDITILKATKEKNIVEENMSKTICRTERFAEKNAADITDDKKAKMSLSIDEADIKSYIEAHELISDIEGKYSMSIDYVKSAPYIMSFMNDYKLKRLVEEYFSNSPDTVKKADKDTLWLKYTKINKYKEIKSNNARLDSVLKDVLREGVEKLLWIPASKPYYEPEEPFKSFSDFTKTLVFSSWQMVPRMISSLLSYEVERRTIWEYAKTKNKKVTYLSGNKNRYPSPRLRFRLKDDRPEFMNIFCMIYPSKCLTELYDPIDCMNKNCSLNDIKDILSEKLKEKLDRYCSPDNGNEDAKWYYLAPLLLDDEEYVRSWFNEFRKDESKIFDDEEDYDRKESTKAHTLYLDELEQMYDEALEAKEKHYEYLGKKPEDLIEVLIDMALASPAVCINRTYRNYRDDKEEFSSALPSKYAEIFIRRMDTPESIAVVELTTDQKGTDGYWRSVLKYSEQGNIQAVLDEYAQMLAGERGIGRETVDRIHQGIVASLKMRTTTYPIDTYGQFKYRVTGKGKKWKVSMRTHYAVSFTKGEGRETDNARKSTLRSAFNSPFRPFVLASTSIGQEGLDFHYYCRQIVHWNLPSNPVDLEQREGRINRFKCLAIRQNIAKRYGNGPFEKDVWNEMFKEAEKCEKTKDCSDLIPYWGLTEKTDMIKIERIVPMYPFSKDELTYERLIKILSLYRLTLGQARQEELMEYLFKNYEENDTIKLKDFFINLSPYFRNKIKQNK